MAIASPSKHQSSGPKFRAISMGIAWLLAFLTSSVGVATAENDAFVIAEVSSPRTTLQSFTDACDEIHELMLRSNRTRIAEPNRKAILEERILSCLDLSGEPQFLRKQKGQRAAICLKEILDRIPVPPVSEIPGDEDVAGNGSTPAVENWNIPRTKVTISLVKEGPRKGEFLFSPRTVSAAPGYFDQIRELPYKPGASEGFYDWFQSNPGPWLTKIISFLPESARNTFWGQQAAWQWIGLAIVYVVGPIVAIGLFMIGRKIAKRKKRHHPVLYILSIAFPISAMFVPLFVGIFVKDQLRITGSVMAFTSFSTNIIFLFSLMAVVIGVGSRISEIIISTPRINSKGLDAQLIRIVCRVLTLLAATFVFLEGGQFLGIPLSTLLASAGVGGFALALAAQDSLKNFFGSMMIILDRPFKVGERIKIGSFDGIVEEIGLRSTRLRLLNGHQATIPNEEMAKSHIENIGRRPHVRRSAILRLPLDTSSDKARTAVSIIEKILENHEGMKPELPPRVFFTEIESDCLGLQMVYWYHPPEYWEYLAFSQKVNLSIKEQFEAAGIQFALPTNLTHLTGERELDPQQVIDSLVGEST